MASTSYIHIRLREFNVYQIRLFGSQPPLNLSGERFLEMDFWLLEGWKAQSYWFDVALYSSIICRL